mgnify:CR=1 FL=1
MFEQVRDVIVDTLSCDLEAVTMDARLVEDLEADSLDAVGDIVRYLEAHQG